MRRVNVRAFPGVPTLVEFSGAFRYRDRDEPVIIVNTITGKAYAKLVDDSIVEIGAGGGAAWGGITGTLSDQSDLQSALDGKEVAGAVAAHEAAGDPHAQYLRQAEADALYEALGAVAAHAGAADPHTGYQRESEKDAASGYAGLDLNSRLVLARLPLADADGKLLIRRAGLTAYDLLAATDLPTHASRHHSGGADALALGSIAGSLVIGQIPDALITLAKIANIATARILGRTTAGSGVIEELTGTQITAMLDNFTSTLKGLVPGSGGGTTNFLRADGTWAAPPSGGGSGPSTVKITADQTKNNTTMANITGLSFAVTSGRYYRFVFEIVMRTATATTGPRLSVTVPAFTVFAAKVTGPVATDGVGNEFRGEITASDDAVILTALPVANTDYMCKIEGIIKPSANGTLQARFANETGTVVVTARDGSMGFLWDLGT